MYRQKTLLRWGRWRSLVDVLTHAILFGDRVTRRQESLFERGQVRNEMYRQKTPLRWGRYRSLVDVLTHAIFFGDRVTRIAWANQSIHIAVFDRN